MQALWSERAAGRLNTIQSSWFEPRPREALYDLAKDPHEVVNLAEDPDHLAILSRFRSAYGAWRIRVTDSSDIPEAEIAQRFWPDGRQPATPAPVITLTGQGTIDLRASAGASIEYRIDAGAWRVYGQPLELAPGVTVRARAVRYGYAVSAEVSLVLEATPRAGSAGTGSNDLFKPSASVSNTIRNNCC